MGRRAVLVGAAIAAALLAASPALAAGTASAVLKDANGKEVAGPRSPQPRAARS